MIELTDLDFKEYLGNHEIVIVDFWAPWCAPCKAFGPTFQDAADKYSNDQLKFAKVNTDLNSTTSLEHQIRSIPTIVIFKNSEEIRRVSGMMDKKTLAKLISEIQ